MEQPSPIDTRSEIGALCVSGPALANSNAPVAVLQFLRVIREAGLPDRKLFYDGLQMRRWVAEILTAAEAARLADFIDESEA